ncbi:dermonecrotic toxin domain-containing protein [Pseudomonas sp. DSP3-2-2]|uniref:dermonecrotic toxin domain-containing protein n=1 Tax=unclassified Pseudomonas TaxID=196821 RepID=UPI003CF18EE2
MPAINPTPNLEIDQLKTLGIDLVEACPDMREMARDVAKTVLKNRTGSDIEPDTVYWHRFATAMSSPLTFNGWQHLDKPIESMTLPQLVLHRFNAPDQDNADNLQMMGGFYTAGPEAGAYNTSNEVKMLPVDVMNDFWNIDFCTAYRARLDAFWQSSADEFRTLAKANFLAKALEERESEHLGVTDLQTLLNAVAANVHAPFQLSMLTDVASVPTGLRVTAFDIGGHQASDILRVVTSTGRQIIYIPGETFAFQAFDTPEHLRQWLVDTTEKTPDRARFLAHFPLAVRHENDPDAGLDHLMDLLPAHADVSAGDLLNQLDQDLGVDAFTWLRDAARDRMNADADFSLRSNGDLRKQMWIGYLDAFSHVLGPLAALDWPIALAVVGAGLADMGLNIDQAVNGHTTAERKAGVIGAILSAMDTLLNCLFLLDAGISPMNQGETEYLATFSEDSHLQQNPGGTENSVEAPTAVALPDTASENAELISRFRSNHLLAGFTPSTQTGRMHGIYQLANGEAYIAIEHGFYQVRYVNEVNSWVIIDPQNPFSFYDNLPVRLNAEGNWEVINRSGLRGGGPAASRILRTPRPLPQASVISTYEVPESMRAEVIRGANGSDRAVLRGDMMPMSSNWQDPYEQFRAIRERLRTDACDFYAHLELPGRPQMPEFEAQASSKSILRSFFHNNGGLVIGESHSGIGSKRFLIENMKLLKKLKVRTLYIEHLLTDFHQADLDEFARSGRMGPKLEQYLKNMDLGHSTDPSGRYSFLQVIKVANENRIRVQAIDCMASYRLDGMQDPDNLARHKMMNFIARSIISADAARLGASNKWIALVGNSHANTFQGVTGISELEGAIGLRIEDVAPGDPEGLTIDPGRTMPGDIGEPDSFVKSDFRLQVAVSRTFGRMPSDRLVVQPGMFIIDQSSGEPMLVHRSKNNSVVRTRIKNRFGKVFIDRPQWPAISKRAFNNIGDLIAALELIGMRNVN